MSRFFIAIYDWFESRRWALYVLLASLVVLMGIFALKVGFNENISSFFGEDDASSAVFDNIRIKDRIAVLVSGDSPDAMIEAGEAFADSLQFLIEDGLVKSIVSGADGGIIESSVDFMYRYLPVFMEDSDYERIDSCLTGKAIDEAVRSAYDILVSPAGFVVKDMVLRDPISIGTHLMKRFERFAGDYEYQMYSGHIFTPEMDMMLMYIEPSYGMGDTGDNAALVASLEEYASRVSSVTGTGIVCVGGPIVAVYNANQIKKDTATTMGFAMLLILVFIFMSFRSRRTVPLMIMPPLFGALFAMALIYFIQGYISAIAIGAGSVVLGVSLSYSIHVVAHSNHTDDPRQIIEDLAYPLTVGSFTTIGAFAALMFTSSPLLRDMGLFSVLALIGTAVCCLVFLPHFIRKGAKEEERPLLKWIEKVNGVSYENKKWVIALIAVLTVFCLFFYQDVTFDSDMSHINFVPEHIAKAERQMEEAFGNQNSGVLIACSADDLEDASNDYYRLDSLMLALQGEGSIGEYVSVMDFVLAPSVQKERISKWNSFWETRRDRVEESVRRAASKYGFRSNAFDGFIALLDREYEVCDYSEEVIGTVPALADWINPTEKGTLFLSRIKIDEENKEHVYALADGIGHVSVIDRAYFSSRMVTDTSEDFDFILWISSFIVFFALLLSYGRIELAVMTFLPMLVSWVIILGFMAVFGLQFNIVNIILATFIFGIGDDFSIFIMDGLIHEYRTGRKMLGAHKTAIFFSAFTTIVGIGAMIFARHPALKSIAVISVLGIAVVILVSYTVQPFLFKVMISSPTRKGGFPYTLGSILNTVYAFVYFFIGCLIARVYRLLLCIIPMKRTAKKASFHRLLYRITRIFMGTMVTVRTERQNPYGETVEKPAMIIANHQSFVDLLLMLSTHPKIIMLTNDWVWKSPFFGKIVQYADCYHIGDGYEALADKLRDRVREGYSILVFPEGTRSADCSILRFHKGAFYLAEELQLDIVPVAIYGAGLVCSKEQGFYIKHGYAVTRILKRIPYGDSTFGKTYQEKAKNYRAFFREQYRSLNDEYGRVSNPYFRNALITNYIYKGPVLEWYMRVKARIDGYYGLWDTIVPRDAAIADVGCGYGQMSIMLGILSKDRTIVGLDYDEEKVTLASNSFLRPDNVGFRCADMVSCVMPESDVFLFNDSLHYVDEESQRQVLEHCLASLNEDGMLIVRDADSSNEAQHGSIINTEKWSTRILKFNRTHGELAFVSRGWMQEFADAHGLDLKVRKCDSRTSEMMYIMKRRKCHEGQI